MPVLTASVSPSQPLLPTNTIFLMPAHVGNILRIHLNLQKELRSVKASVLKMPHGSAFLTGSD